MQHLKDIERLIKTQIPRVAIDSFVPPTHIPAEAPRPPRPQHGQKRHSNTTAGNRPAREGQAPSSNRPPREGQAPRNPDAARSRQPRDPQARDQRSQQPSGQPRTGQPAARPRPAQPAEKLLSEAARHQAMPQPALFSPRPAARRGK